MNFDKCVCMTTITIKIYNITLTQFLNVIL